MPIPEIQNALNTVKDVLADLELIEFFAEWLVALLMPARHVLETRSPHFSFMLLKDYWFKELYLGLKVAASLDRTESFIMTIEGHNLGCKVSRGSGASCTYRGGPHMRSLISIDFPAPEMEPESAHVVSAVSVP